MDHFANKSCTSGNHFMFPRIFQFGSFTLYSFGLLYAVGVIVAILTVRWRARRAEIDQGKATDLALWVMLGVMLGAKLLMVLTDFNFYLAHPGELFSLSSLQAGGVFYGGFLGALVAAAPHSRGDRAGLRRASASRCRRSIVR